MCGGLVAKMDPTPVTPWTTACQAPLSMDYHGLPSELPFSLGDLPHLGIECTQTVNAILSF